MNDSETAEALDTLRNPEASGERRAAAFELLLQSQAAGADLSAVEPELKRWETLDDPLESAAVAYLLGHIAAERADYSDARSYWRSAFSENNPTVLGARAAGRLAELAASAGDQSNRDTWRRRSLEQFGRAGYPGGFVGGLLRRAADLESDGELAFAARITEGAVDVAFRFAPEELGLAIGSLALLDARHGRHDRALEGFRESLGHARKAGDTTSEAVALANLSSTSQDLGRAGEAIRWARKVLRCEGLATVAGLKTEISGRLAALLARSQRFSEALELIDEALPDTDDKTRLASLGAEIALAAEQPASARAYLDQADPTEAPPGEASRVHYLEGMLFAEARQPEKAVEAFRLSLELQPELEVAVNALAYTLSVGADPGWLLDRMVSWGETPGLLAALRDAAALAVEGGHGGAAAQILERAADVAQTPKELALALNDWAIQIDDPDQALAVLTRSRRAAAKADDPFATALAALNTAETRRRRAKRGDLSAAQEHLTTALEAAEEAEDEELRVHALNIRGLVELDLAKTELAESTFSEALSLATTPETEASAHAGLGNTAEMAGDHATGVRHYRESLRLRRRHGLDRSEESLAGLVRNLAAKPQRALNYWVQQLADYGVETGDPIAADTFLKAGTRLAMNANLDRAAELYALAVITPLASAADVDQELVQAAWGTVWAAIELLVDHGDGRDSAATRLKRAVVLIAGPDSGIDGIVDEVVTAEVLPG